MLVASAPIKLLVVVYRIYGLSTDPNIILSDALSEAQYLQVQQKMVDVMKTLRLYFVSFRDAMI